MVASPALIGSAQKLQQSALCELLEAYWAVVHRVAWALCGQPAAAQQVVERVMARARTAALREELGRAYRALGPAEQALRPQIRSRVRRFLWPRRVRRVVAWIIAAAIAWGAWTIWKWMR